MDSWYLENLACPRDNQILSLTESSLTCRNGHRYPVIDGIPVMLLEGIEQTLHVAEKSISESKALSLETDLTAWHLDSLGISEDQRRDLIETISQSHSHIDPVVSYLVAATNGIAYKHLVGNLKSYPIPKMRLPRANGETLLDIGCNWGRWCVAAARLGYAPIGIDPSLGAVLTARRVLKSLGLRAHFIVGDGRHLPFKSQSIDTVFSYSVLQHFSREDAKRSVDEAYRVLRTGGRCFIQMPTTLGIRCLYHQARRGFKEATHFDVRYWSVPSLKKLFSKFGSQSVSVDCFFGIGLQPADLPLMPITHKIAILSSEVLRWVSRWFSPLRYLADSVYIQGRKIGA